MKKTIALFLTFGMFLVFTACGQQAQNDSNNEFDIASQEWTMTTIQSRSVEDNGMIVAYGSDDGTSEQAAKIAMVCSAKEGQFVITDQTNSKTYSGEYTVESESDDSTIYNISIGDAKGMAVVSYTKYHDDSQVGTLILSFEDYALSFSGQNN